MPSAAEAVRVTVASGARRVDLCLPAGVPVVELAPVLTELLDRGGGAGGVPVAPRLVRLDGTTLDGGLGLAAQGVVDGAVLGLALDAGVGETPRFDDPVEAMAEAVARDVRRWPETAGRRTAVAVGVASSALAAAALEVGQDRETTATWASASAVGLLLLAAWLSRRGGPGGGASAATGCLYAGVAGSCATPWGGPHLGSPALWGGCAALGAVAVAWTVLVGDRSCLLAPAVVGCLVAAGAVLVARAGVPVTALGAGLVGLAAVADGVTPTAAVALGGSVVATPTADREAIGLDVDRITAQARCAHSGLVVLTVTLGAIMALAAPLAAARGPSGMLVDALAGVLMAVRARHRWSAALVGAGLVSSGSVVLLAGATALWLHPRWTLQLGLAGLLAGVGLLVVSSTSWLSMPRAVRLVELAEGIALVMLVPAVLVATGLLGAVRR